MSLGAWPVSVPMACQGASLLQVPGVDEAPCDDGGTSIGILRKGRSDPKVGLRLRRLVMMSSVVRIRMVIHRVDDRTANGA